jgi:hypothetical protein
MRVVKSPALGLVGLAAIAIIALGLLRQQVTLAEAAQRAVVVVVLAAVADRLLLPIGRLLVGYPRDTGGDEPEAAEIGAP